VLTASTALMMEAVSTSETLVNFYETIECNIPEDNQLIRIHHRENLTSHIDKFIVKRFFILKTNGTVSSAEVTSI
jgi:hypothetical protein